MNCIHCGADLSARPEPEAGDWLIRCFACGAKNLVTAVLQIVGWRA
jgi:DNA-directed RNA polymerase subunit RPC12/RpoP